MRIVDAKYCYALLDPEENDVAQRAPNIVGAAIRIEFDIDDILVFLRRVFGETQRTVGAPAKPIRMAFQPGMVRRALNCEIERDL